MTTQGNNNFFKTFFSKDKLWYEIQNNPIARDALMPTWRPRSIVFQVTQNDGTVGPALIDEVIDFGAPVGNKRLRMDAPQYRWHTLKTSHSDTSGPSKYKTIKGLGPRPAPGIVYPDPAAAPAAGVRAARIENLRGFIYHDRFKEVLPDRFNRDYTVATQNLFEWAKVEDDNWLPQYEGDWFSLPEKSSKRAPTSYDKDKKFLPDKPFLTDKQKEYFVWSKAVFV